MTSIAIIYGTSEGQTAKIAEYIAAALKTRNVTATLYNGQQNLLNIPLLDHDGALVGASVHLGRHQAFMEQFVKDHALELNRLPSGFFSVSLTAKQAQSDAAMQAEVAKYITAFTEATHWQPTLTASFAGALKYRDYNFVKRAVTRRVSELREADTDTSRNHEYTDWDAVERFIDAFLKLTTAQQNERGTTS